MKDRILDKESDYTKHVLNAICSVLEISPGSIKKIEFYDSCSDSPAIRSNCIKVIEDEHPDEIASFSKTENTDSSILCFIAHLQEKHLWCLLVDPDELYANLFTYAVWDQSMKKWIYRADK